MTQEHVDNVVRLVRTFDVVPFLVLPWTEEQDGAVFLDRQLNVSVQVGRDHHGTYFDVVQNDEVVESHTDPAPAVKQAMNLVDTAHLFGASSRESLLVA